jgi:hypothetical protein
MIPRNPRTRGMKNIFKIFYKIFFLILALISNIDSICSKTTHFKNFEKGKNLTFCQYLSISI